MNLHEMKNKTIYFIATVITVALGIYDTENLDRYILALTTIVSALEAIKERSGLRKEKAAKSDVQGMLVSANKEVKALQNKVSNLEETKISLEEKVVELEKPKRKTTTRKTVKKDK